MINWPVCLDLRSSPVSSLSQDIDCYVIDNNGFVLISKQRRDVSWHTQKMCLWLDCLTCQDTWTNKNHQQEKIQLSSLSFPSGSSVSESLLFRSENNPSGSNIPAINQALDHVEPSLLPYMTVSWVTDVSKEFRTEHWIPLQISAFTHSIYQQQV